MSDQDESGRKEVEMIVIAFMYAVLSWGPICATATADFTRQIHTIVELTSRSSSGLWQIIGSFPFGDDTAYSFVSPKKATQRKMPKISQSDNVMKITIFPTFS
ncbi:hypothetical protein K435DRAFT_789547 [Dendrothele bispora CBS 962.96]|uniref:Uncharacterized protein n=1 Tax=Dendrothele bispora (strain CBS 962.96) TaxID=1314807 RepID=A0A4S8MTR4_DENBC|nr:hypothetical protein K435DRAFT_789547 [Dendrothele bispora CBS 962.96]